MHNQDEKQTKAKSTKEILMMGVASVAAEGWRGDAAGGSWVLQFILISNSSNESLFAFFFAGLKGKMPLKLTADLSKTNAAVIGYSQSFVFLLLL